MSGFKKGFEKVSAAKSEHKKELQQNTAKRRPTGSSLAGMAVGGGLGNIIANRAKLFPITGGDFRHKAIVLGGMAIGSRMGALMSNKLDKQNES